jgi:hypothetical protein
VVGGVGGRGKWVTLRLLVLHTRSPSASGDSATCHSANSIQPGRVVVSIQVLCFQRLAPAAFRLCHVASGSSSPIRARLAASWLCQYVVSVRVSVCQGTRRASRFPARKELPLLGPTRVRPGGFRGPGERTVGLPGWPWPSGCRPARRCTSRHDLTPLMTRNLRDSHAGNSRTIRTHPVPASSKVSHGRLPAHIAPSGRCKSN